MGIGLFCFVCLFNLWRVLAGLENEKILTSSRLSEGKCDKIGSYSLNNFLDWLPVFWKEKTVNIGWVLHTELSPQVSFKENVHSGIKIVNVNHCQVSINTSNLGVSYVECTYSHRYKVGRKKYVCAISFFLKTFEILSTCIKVRDHNYFFVL